MQRTFLVKSAHQLVQRKYVSVGYTKLSNRKMHAWCIWLVNKDIVGCLHRNRILPLGDGAPWWRQIDTHILQPRWQWQRQGTHAQKREVCMHQESIVGPTHLL